MIREEEIRQVAQEYIATDEHNGVGVRTQAFIDGAKWADSHRASPWHSVADGDLPNFEDIVLINTKEYGVITALYDKGWVGVEVPLFYSADCARTDEEVDYWMEIPELPE